MSRLVCLIALALLSCDAGQTEQADYRRRLLIAWGQDVVVPDLQRFEAAASVLSDASAALCAAPNAQSLQAARDAWSSARSPWKQVEVFRFGPYRDEPLRLGPKLDFWPMRPESIQRRLDGMNGVDADTLATAGAAERGLPAVEYLLWSVDDPAAFVDRHCAYLVGASADVATSAQRMRAAWDPAEGDYAGQLANSGRGGAYDTLQMAFAEVVSRMGHTIENIRFEKLGKPVGLDGADPQPDKTESPLSGRALDDIRDNLIGISALYHGANDGLGLSDYLAFRGHDFDASFESRVQAARAALDAIPEPLNQAVVDAPDTVRAAIDALFEIERLIQVDIANALSVNLTFNDSDGD